jgi:endogenous inhibitor of DNA gyrase (YacG/DUF329 family)
LPGRRPYGYDDAVTDEDRARAAGSRCPTCDRIVAWTGNPARPFCSISSRLIDLGHWLDGTVCVPRPPPALPDPPVSVGPGRAA